MKENITKKLCNVHESICYKQHSACFILIYDKELLQIDSWDHCYLEPKLGTELDICCVVMVVIKRLYVVTQQDA
jgi:hypothetical protein